MDEGGGKEIAERGPRAARLMSLRERAAMLRALCDEIERFGDNRNLNGRMYRQLMLTRGLCREILKAPEVSRNGWEFKDK